MTAYKPAPDGSTVVIAWEDETVTYTRNDGCWHDGNVFRAPGPLFDALWHARAEVARLNAADQRARGEERAWVIKRVHDLMDTNKPLNERWQKKRVAALREVLDAMRGRYATQGGDA